MNTDRLLRFLPALLGVAALTAPAADWPRWRGVNLDGLCTETGLLQAWPEQGPPLLWTLDGLGAGYSSVSVAQGRLYTMGDVPNADKGKDQVVICLDLATQKKLWTTRIGPSQTDGPRSTPTVDGGRVLAVGTDGDLACLDAATGKPIWQKHFVRDFGGKMMSGWRYSESPLVDGEQVICTPGAPDAMLVALNKRTGETIWKCAMPALGPRGKDGAGYSSPVIAWAGDVRQYVQLVGRGCIGVAAKDGRFLWGYNRIANGTANIPTPVVRSNQVFCSTAYDGGAALLRLVPTGEGGVKAEEAYYLDGGTFQNHHGGFVLVGDYLYGGHGHARSAPMCIEFMTGKVRWKQTQPASGTAAVLYADGHLIFRYQEGQVCLIAASPEGYQLRGLFKPSKQRGMSGPAWAHPVIADGKLYLRHNDVLQCYDLKAR